MVPDQGKIKRLKTFLTNIQGETYPEAPTNLHTSLTRKMMEYFIGKYPLAPKSRILDVGCGQGVALDLFKEKGFKAIGITLNNEDLSICVEKGFTVYNMDQSFLDFDEEEFDFIWCRHCIEHSIFPYFTLTELFRVLIPGGYLYIEVPAPDTNCKHHINRNHYSVLGRSMWAELIKRAGFNILEIIDIDFEDLPGPDTYYAYIQEKPKLGERALNSVDKFDGESNNCMICGSHELLSIATNRSFGVNILECAECEFIQSEYISQAAIDDYYSVTYRENLSDRKILELRRKSLEQATYQFEYITSLLPDKQFGNVLDYGGSDGELAKLLKKISKKAYITEADPRYADILKDDKDLIFVTDNDLKSDNFNRYFDLIAISHVLEHLNDPLAILDMFSRLLRRGGYLFVDIPNEVELLKRTGFQAKGHLSYFTMDSFGRFVDRHGAFDIVEIRACNRSVEEFIASGFKLPEQYFRTQTPNGTVIRSLLINNFKGKIPKGIKSEITEPDKEIKRGELIFQQGEIQEALKLFERAYEIQPDNLTALNNIGVALNSLGRYSEAVEVFSKVLKTDSNNSDAAFNLITNFLVLNRWNDAENAIAQYGRSLKEDDIEIIMKELEKAQSSDSVTRSPGKRTKADTFNYFKFQDRINMALSKNLFFIMGVPKSGTTWLQYLLNSHPEILCSGEGNFNQIIKDLQNMVNGYNSNIVWSNKAIGTSDYLLFSRDNLQYLFVTAVGLLFGNMTVDPGVKCLGSKNPILIKEMEIHGSSFPSAKFIHIIRDGRDVIVSAWFNNMRRDGDDFKKSWPDFHSFVGRTAQSWASDIKKARLFGHSNPERYLEVRYEDLHSDPEPSIQRILAFLGVSSSSPIIHKCLEAGKFERLSKGRRRGQEDKNAFFRKGIIGDWKNHFDEKSLSEFMRHGEQLMRELGYS